MRSLQYLNTVLTMIALLLTLNLWTLWTTGPTDAGEFLVQRAHAAGLADPGKQRREIVDLLKRLVQQSETLIDLLQSGKARFRVAGPG